MPQFDDVTVQAGGQLTLSSFTIDDVPALLDAVADDEIRRWLPLPDPYTRALAESWCTSITRELRDSGRGLVLAIRDRGEFAGCIDAKRVDWRAMSAEFGYWSAAGHRGRGLMPTAVNTRSTWMIRELRFERIELRIAPDNQKSIRVAQKAGFTAEGIARNAGFTDTGRVDLAIFSRIRTDLARPM
ncbi:GNAT family N-acetyltransferase [Microbacterium aurantiacum]|uniref:GNAT family N-acetyltransferase n=1 Tax=Microbacterium aurantiacum TaxID=162393 RepID=UPI000C80D506|nr:GNAT family N-acetyltransferase [Microbacterium aurantiacum]